MHLHKTIYFWFCIRFLHSANLWMGDQLSESQESGDRLWLLIKIIPAVNGRNQWQCRQRLGLCQTSGADQCLINADFMENQAFVIRFTHRMNSGCGFQTERDYLKLQILPLLDLQQLYLEICQWDPIADVQDI